MDIKDTADKFLLTWEKWSTLAVEALSEDVNIYTTLHIGPLAVARQKLLETLRELCSQYLTEMEGKTHE